MSFFRWWLSLLVVVFDLGVLFWLVDVNGLSWNFLDLFVISGALTSLFFGGFFVGLALLIFWWDWVNE